MPASAILSRFRWSLAALAGVLAFWFLTRLIVAWIPSGSREEEDRAAARVRNLQALQEQDRRALETYGWVDRGKGIVRVPIERAMELVLPELNARKPARAYPVPPANGPAPDPRAAPVP